MNLDYNDRHYETLKKGEYALRALIDLGIAAAVGRSLVQVTELADT